MSSPGKAEDDDRRGGRRKRPGGNGRAGDAERASVATETENENGTSPAESPASDRPLPEAFARKQDTVDERRPPKRKRTILIIVGLVVIAGAVGGLLWWLEGRHFEKTDDAYVEGHVVSISPQVSARVRAVHVEDNQLVKQGELMVELEPVDFEVTIGQAEAAQASAAGKLEQAKSQVAAGEAGLSEARATLRVAQVNFANLDRELKRWQTVEERARSQSQLENAQAARDTAEAQVKQFDAKLATAESQVKAAEAAVAAAEGDQHKAAEDVHRAKVNLGYTKIVAPVSGRVTRRSVEMGAYVTPQQPVLALVPPEVWVVANYKETQLERMRPGQETTVWVDAFGGQAFSGHVDSIQAGTGARFSVLPAENATGNFVKVVQRVPVKIVLDRAQLDDGRFLSPGMSVEVHVKVR